MREEGLQFLSDGTHFLEHSLKIQWIDGEAKKDPLMKNLAKE